MTRHPDHYECLELDAQASPEEIERAYRRRVAELRASRVADAREELTEVEAAYSVLGDPNARSQYDADRKSGEARLELKYAELDTLMPRTRRHVRKFTKGSSGWIDALSAIFKFLR